MEAPWTPSRPRSWSERQEKVPRSVTDGVKVGRPVGVWVLPTAHVRIPSGKCRLLALLMGLLSRT